MVRPNVQRAQAKQAVIPDKSQVGRIRHLRQAAEHLAAAGYTEHAAKARGEIGRLEAELKQARHEARTLIDKVVPQKAPRRDFNLQQTKPGAVRAPDANAAMLSEMRKLSKQIEQLNGRMQKLEARGAE
jgi:hypothetical protein